MYSRLATASVRIVSLPTSPERYRTLVISNSHQPASSCVLTDSLRPNSFLLFADVRVLASLCHVYELALTLAPPLTTLSSLDREILKRVLYTPDAQHLPLLTIRSSDAMLRNN